MTYVMLTTSIAQEQILDATLIQTLKKINHVMDNINKSNVENKDEETLFVRSLVPKLKQLNRSTCELTKLHIQHNIYFP